MGYNFRRCDRDQLFMIPPDVRDWLEKDHPVWSVLAIVESIDTGSFKTGYRPDGKGGAAFEPDMMVALLLYAYMNGITSCRKIEDACRESVPFRVICGNEPPDHTTISRFRNRNVSRMGKLFAESIRMCAEQGLVDPSFIAVDGTKISGNASIDKNRDLDFYKKHFRAWAREGDRIDAIEDNLYGTDGKAPRFLDTEEKRQKFAAEFKRRLEEVDEKVEAHEEKLAGREIEEEASGKRKTGRKPKTPETLREELDGKLKVNLTDPDSRTVKGTKGFLQGYNPQAAVTRGQIIVAACVNKQENDWNNLLPVTREAIDNLKAAGVEKPVETVAADAGYASRNTLEGIEAEEWVKEARLEIYVSTRKERELAIELDKSPRDSDNPRFNGPKRRMEQRLKTPRGKAAFKKRAPTVEPVFAHIKACRGHTRFSMRGLQKCAGEWDLIAASHNLLKLLRAGWQPVAS